MRLKHITPVEHGCAKLIVYPNSSEEYFTFISPEAHSALKEYITYREANGEKITPESYVVRNVFGTTNIKHGAGGLVTRPKAFKSSGIKSHMERAALAAVLRNPLPKSVGDMSGK